MFIGAETRFDIQSRYHEVGGGLKVPGAIEAKGDSNLLYPIIAEGDPTNPIALFHLLKEDGHQYGPWSLYHYSPGEGPTHHEDIHLTPSGLSVVIRNLMPNQIYLLKPINGLSNSFSFFIANTGDSIIETDINLHTNGSYTYGKDKALLIRSYSQNRTHMLFDECIILGFTDTVTALTIFNQYLDA